MTRVCRSGVEDLVGYLPVRKTRATDQVEEVAMEAKFLRGLFRKRRGGEGHRNQMALLKDKLCRGET